MLDLPISSQMARSTGMHVPARGLPYSRAGAGQPANRKTSGRGVIPLILWLLGVPLSLILILWLIGVV